MQYKNILFVFSFLLCTVQVHAQDTIITSSGRMIIHPASHIMAVNMPVEENKHTSVKDYTTARKPLPPVTKKMVADVKTTENTSKEIKIAENSKTTTFNKPGENKIIVSNMPDKKTGYNHVPLAGEKAYFGEKNEYVNDFVRKYLELHNKTLGNVQNSGDHSFSVIDNVLEKKNMPKELKYLAVIESALNHNAVSRAGAVGPWQLMETTARGLGLKVSRRSDDRRDLYKSTTAATKYLELLYGQLNDWLLVIAAYNSGPVPVQRAIERTGSHNFWDIKEYLPRETQGHVLAFIATASIFENLSKFINLGSIPVDFKFGNDEEPAALKDASGKPLPVATAPVLNAPVPPASAAAATTAAPGISVVKKQVFTEDELKNMSIVRITKPIHLDYMAEQLGIDKKQLNRWNADYELFTYNTYPTPYYNLRLPKDKVDQFLQKKEVLTKKSAEIFAGLK
jgi:membrane-bound lytic murein transglycosylase D